MENYKQTISAITNIIAKVTKIEYLLLLLGLLFYMDIFIYFLAQKNISTLTISEISNIIGTLTILNVFQFFIYLLLFFSVVSIPLLVIYKLIYLRLFPNMIYNKYNLESFKHLSILQNHTTAYNYSLNKSIETANNIIQKRIIFVDFILIGFDYILSLIYDDKIFLLLPLTFYNESINSILIGSIEIILGFIVLAIFLFIIDTPTHENEVLIDKKFFLEIEKKEWLNEITLGLVNKDDLLMHLRTLSINKQIYSQISLQIIQEHKELEEAMEYAKHFNLAYHDINKQKIIFKEKGNFFLKYVLDDNIHDKTMRDN